MQTILIVDDEYDIVFALELTLNGAGYRVITGGNGRDALEKIAKERPALIVSDIMMPVMTGLELLKNLKNDPHTADIPLILMSAAAPRGEQSEYGWDAFVRKPFDIGEILALVEKLIGPGQP
jgi:CheY-like chemotaxis protein